MDLRVLLAVRRSKGIVDHPIRRRMTEQGVLGLVETLNLTLAATAWTMRFLLRCPSA